MMNVNKSLMIKIDRRKKIAIYSQIKQSIIKIISMGEVKVGTVLPKPSDYAYLLEVSMSDVQRAYQVLLDEGFIAYTENKYIVIENAIKETSIASIKSLVQTIESAGLKARFETMMIKKVNVFDHPKLKNVFSSDQTLTYYQRIYYANDIPSFVLESYIDLKKYNLEEKDLQHQLIYPILYKKCHVEVKHSKRLVLVEMPTQQVSKLLQSSLKEPIIKLENIFYDQHNDVIDFSIVWTAAHYYIELDF